MYIGVKQNIFGGICASLGWQSLTDFEKYPGNYGNGVKTLFVYKKQNEVLQHAFFVDELS